VTAPTARERSRGLSRALAVCAVVLLAFQAYVIAAWLADGPYQVTAPPGDGDSAWWAARVVEVVVVASVGAVVVRAVRDRRRDGRLGVDALLVAGMASAGFWDPIYNWLTPAWLYSSTFLNVNDWLGHAPGVVNPNMGHQPWPVIIVLVGYPLWGVGFAILIDRAMGRVGGRSARRAAAGLVAAVAITCAAFGAFKALDLMSAPGLRFAALGDQDVLVAGLSGGLVFWALGCLRHFRDARGRAVFQRGSRSGRVDVLAAMASCQLAVVLGWGVLTVPLTTLSSPYPRLPAHLVNGACDAPGTTGTAYGPCPGAAGFDLPRR